MTDALDGLHCPACSVTMRDAPDGLVCPACGYRVVVSGVLPRVEGAGNPWWMNVGTRRDDDGHAPAP